MALFCGTTRVSRYQKGKTNLGFTEAKTVGGRGISWAICKSADNHASTPPLKFFYPSCRPTNSVKALKAPSPHKKDLNVAKHKRFLSVYSANESVQPLLHI